MKLTKEQREVFSKMGQESQKKITTKERIRRGKKSWETRLKKKK